MEHVLESVLRLLAYVAVPALAIPVLFGLRRWFGATSRTATPKENVEETPPSVTVPLGASPADEVAEPEPPGWGGEELEAPPPPVEPLPWEAPEGEGERPLEVAEPEPPWWGDDDNMEPDPKQQVAGPKPEEEGLGLELELEEAPVPEEPASTGGGELPGSVPELENEESQARPELELEEEDLNLELEEGAVEPEEAAVGPVGPPPAAEEASVGEGSGGGWRGGWDGGGFSLGEEASTPAEPAPIPAAVGPSRSLGSAPPRPARFFAFSPEEVAPDGGFDLLAYAVRRGAEGAAAEDVQRRLEHPESFRQAVEEARHGIAEGARVTATPVAPGFEFEPELLTLRFREEWHAYPFRGYPAGAPRGRAVAGQITFTVEGIVVADLPFDLRIEAEPIEAPLLEVKREPYRSIFPSYSHKDTRIVELAERFYVALGDEVLRDAVALRSGQRWDEELLRLIERADLFQLFWSQAAADSHFVRDEWTHALGLMDHHLKPARFVRPLYWEKPMPSQPSELEKRRIHFAPAPWIADLWES